MWERTTCWASDYLCNLVRSNMYGKKWSFEQMYESIVRCVSSWEHFPEKACDEFERYPNTKGFKNWLIDTGRATCKDPEARAQLTEIKERMVTLNNRRKELEMMNLGDIMRGEYSEAFLGIESYSLTYDPNHSEQFNDIKQLLWLCMVARENFGSMIDEEDVDQNPLYDMDMELFSHIRKMFPNYIKELMLPGAEEYEKVIDELTVLRRRYDNACKLITFVLPVGCALSVLQDFTVH